MKLVDKKYLLEQAEIWRHQNDDLERPFLTGYEQGWESAVNLIYRTPEIEAVEKEKYDMLKEQLEGLTNKDIDTVSVKAYNNMISEYEAIIRKLKRRIKFKLRKL